MSRVLTEKQVLLTRYFTAKGCQTEAIVLMMLQLYNDEMAEKMIMFCKENPNASQAELLSTASKISSEYERAHPDEYAEE